MIDVVLLIGRLLFVALLYLFLFALMKTGIGLVRGQRKKERTWNLSVERGPKELRPTQRMMRFPSIAITRDGMVLRESAPVKVMQFDDGGGEAKLQEE